MVELKKKKMIAGAIAAAMAFTITPLSGATAASVKALKVGFVSPQTGPLAGFGEADKYEITQITAYFKKNPITVGSTRYNVQVILKDAPSSAAASAAASDLINNNNVDLILASSTPDIVNPVSDQCEANSVPCITTVAPWQLTTLVAKRILPSQLHSNGRITSSGALKM